MSVKLYISEGIKKAELEIAKPNNLQLLNVIHGLYGFFGVEIPGIGEQKPVSTQHVFEPNIQIPRAFEKTSQPREEKKSIELPKRQLPYVNGDRTLTQNLGEKLGPLLGLRIDEPKTAVKEPPVEQVVDPAVVKSAEQKEQPKYTGIKEINGELHYQTYVYCKNVQCCKRNKVFIKKTQVCVPCPACNTKHARRDASSDGFPNQDDFGNFFKADRLWIENHKPHQERVKSPLK
ncbi:hypothetical protein KDJ56_07140 [Brevibacillus composti]|uniref:Uncharacterized protein n=1 Tax=Brevibacillus composti TaxID=2796470 RepID=A0A7T5JQ25_9BACL|nr:hypothetical protein [Brevibacillus composti]QQE75705.1 hypothetical protein JD108_07460 [Brevibacillus composti]QUO42731.1 hypothetical protein KDJ56_07140 [Brevibacillus composti]